MAGAPGDSGDTPGGQNFHDAVLKVFVDLYDKGLIYKGKRLVNWDPHFETAISDLEVENIDVQGHMWHFKYPLEGGQTYEYVEKDADGNVTLRETRDYISIATTRPETMLGDGAVAVHPSDERYAPIVGKLCEIPVGPKEHRRLIPIITDEYPDPSFGSGAVKITGAHDFNDYGVAKRGNIPCYRLMDTKGAMRADGAPYAEEAAKALAIARGGDFDEAGVDAINLVPDDLRGLDRFDARKKVVEQITSEGLAVMVDGPIDDSDGRVCFATDQVPLVEDKIITQPFGDRSKVVIEPMLTDQWFVDTAKIVQPAIDAVRDGRTQILPEQHKKVYFQWLENIEPWCISRQLWWGHQIPVWYGPTNLEMLESYDVEGSHPTAGKSILLGADRLDGQNRPLGQQDSAQYLPLTLGSRLATTTAKTFRSLVLDSAITPDAYRYGVRHWWHEAICRTNPRPRRPRHLVLLRPLAHWHAGLARGDAGTPALLPHRCPDHRLRHHLLLGRPDDDDAA